MTDMQTSKGQEVCLEFDGSFDGFLCVVYEVYHKKIIPLNIQTQAEITLTENPHVVSTGLARAERVFSAIKEKISYEAASKIYYAFLSYEQGRFMALIHYIKLGFSTGHLVDSHLHLEYVRLVNKMANHAGKEAHLLYGFCRFEQTKQGVLYCKITPRNDVLPLVADYFSQRLLNETWMIHDITRNQAALYDGRDFIITHVPRDISVDYADCEEEVQKQWLTFFNSITIEARANKKLQRQLLPLYFRKNMTEFVKQHELSLQPRY